MPKIRVHEQVLDSDLILYNLEVDIFATLRLVETLSLAKVD